MGENEENTDNHKNGQNCKNCCQIDGNVRVSDEKSADRGIKK